MSKSIHVEGDNNLNFQGIKDSTITVHQNSIAKPPKELTLRIPKIHLSEVIGRETELEDLHQLLFDNKQVVVVNGMGGIGKTTLAQAYMSQYYEKYKHIAWISQSSENAVESSFVNAEGLKENLKIDTQGKDLPTLFNEVLLGLKSLTDKPNLLVIDNTENSLTPYFDRLPNQPNWHLLVTSRENIELFYLKELGFLSLEKALDLFQKHCTLIKDVEAIKDLLHIVDYHTLTIEILAKTAQKLRTDISALKNAIESDLKSPIFIKHKGDKIDKVRSYLCSIFDLSKLNENEIGLMKQLACLPSEFHTYELLLELIKPEDEHKENFAETLTELAAKGWVLNNTKNDSYKMHRVIAEVAYEKLALAIEDITNLMDSISQKLSIDQSKDNPIDKFQWIPFGDAVLSHFDDETNNNTTAVLQNNLALVLKDLGDYEGAKKLLEKATISDETKLGEKHPSTARSYSNLALVLKDLGDYNRAKKLFEKATFSAEINFGEKHQRTAGYYSNLGLVLRDLGDFEGAKKLLEKATISDEANFGEKHPSTARSYSNLATVYFQLGDLKKAIVLLKKAYDIYRNHLGENHPNTQLMKRNLDFVKSQK